MIKDKYLLAHYGNILEEVQQENKTLEISFSQASYLNNIERLIMGLGFEEVSQVSYIKLLTKPIVSK